MTDEQFYEVMQPKKPKWGRRLVIGGVAAVVVIGAGVAAFAAGEGPGHWRGKLMQGFMEYRMEQALTDAGANQTQKDQIKKIFETTMDQVRPSKDDRKAMREEVVKILEAPTIDRNAIEQLRVKHVTEMEGRSKTIAKAVGDAAEVLTPDQRKKLVDEWGQMMPGPDMDHD